MPNPLEKVAAKSAGKVAAVSARAKGLTGVFNKLAEQHKEAATLLKRAEKTDDPAKREDLWTTVRRELLSHERGELRVVYPVLAQNAATRDIAQRHSEEAQTLESTISQIDTAGYESRNWSTSIRQLITLVEQHVEEEESEFFPRAQDAIGKGAADDLEERFMAAKEREMEALGADRK
jgi:hypothetical protein